ncbi:MAG: hypothetical protein AB7I19_05715 [Planctomycetota bacterium]
MLVTRFALTCLATAVALAPIRAQDGPRKTSPIETLALGSGIDWIADPEIHVDGRRPERRLRQPVDRNGLIDEAVAKASESGRSVLWYVPRIVEKSKGGVQMYRAPILDNYAMQLLFEDQDLVDLVRTRFVAARVSLDETLAARFDLRPLECVEPMLVVLDSEGRRRHVIRAIRTFDAHWFVEILRTALAGLSSNSTEPAPVDAEQALAEGRYGLAAELLAKLPESSTARGLTNARLQRRLRRPDTALAALDRLAEASDLDRSLLSAERSRVLLLAGRDTEIPAEWIDAGSQAPAANYWMALAALRRGEEALAVEWMQRIATTWPDSPFGRRAHANVLIGDDERPVGGTFCGFETMRWLPDIAYSIVPNDTARHWVVSDPAEIAATAIEHLLSLQRDDGGFKDSRYAYWPSPKITPNAWIAITALAATALLEFREVAPERIPTDRIDSALARAEDYMFNPDHMARGENEDVYADTYRLLYLARRSGHVDSAERAKLVERMNLIIGEAKERQDSQGFFAHEYANAFCTAAMMWGLLRAQESGATVPPEMMSRGIAALVAARAPDGSFGYSGTRKSSLKDASERMPVCEGILFALKQSDDERLRFAFDNYWENLTRIEKVRRNDFHSDGELAGFFFYHGLFHASEILARLPESLAGDGKERMREILARVAEVDGSYLDSHEIGRSYATAMALLTLRNVMD